MDLFNVGTRCACNSKSYQLQKICSELKVVINSELLPWLDYGLYVRGAF